MKKILIIGSLIIFISIFSKSAFADTPFHFSYDYSIFKGSDGKSIIEFYYSFYKKGLTFIYSEGKYSAEARIDLDIYKKDTQELVYAQTYKISTSVDDTSGSALDNNLVGQLNYQINPGEYSLRIIASDNNSSESDTLTNVVEVDDYNSGLKLSEVQLSTHIVKANDKESIFYKNTLEVVPNPNGMYGNNVDQMYYYFELYGIKEGNITDDFYILTEVKDLNKENVLLKNLKKISDLSSEDIVQFGSFEIDSLPTNPYILSISVVDNRNTQRSIKEKQFWVYNSNIFEDVDLTGDDEYLKSIYPKMREDLVEKEYEITTYIRTSQEAQAFNDLKNINDKRKFLYEFWKRRDTNPSTPQNEFKIEFVNRVIQADASFKEQGREGWKTDRGRIYVLYGKPDDIERFPFEANKKSHEIWTYEKLQGGSIAVFVERSPEGSGFFDLVHSTIRTELRNDNWESDLDY